ncbi:MAG: AbrB/MazE/SpoVT family DNA-binding domain-containing protein [Acutalibacteraceae bacterium]|jgi:transcriptional pleiotropic regulator of transition state genes|nr:AbrB/MazE/SpoVT family DNA-binding domain-containing protein [Bacillota bacterium]
MKSIGIVRKIDAVGRIVLPIELRKTMNITDDSSLEIFVDDDKIVLKKYQPACIFCNEDDNVVLYKGKNICKNCIDALVKSL